MNSNLCRPRELGSSSPNPKFLTIFCISQFTAELSLLPLSSAEFESTRLVPQANSRERFRHEIVEQRRDDEQRSFILLPIVLGAGSTSTGALKHPHGARHDHQVHSVVNREDCQGCRFVDV